MLNKHVVISIIKQTIKCKYLCYPIKKEKILSKIL